jgi:predicted MFS family arabinose efflux permease
MSSHALLGGIGRALSNVQFRRYWTSNALSTVGRWIYRTAVMWFIWELTKSTTWLGVVAFADIFPMVVLSVFAGAISDRIGYMRVIKDTQLAIVILTAVFSALIITDLITAELVVALSIIHGSIEAMSTPPRVAVVNALVEKADLSSAIALNSAMFNASRILGPAIAGGLLLVIDVGMVLLLAMITFVQFYIVLLFLRVEQAGGTGKISMSLITDMWDGILYAWRHSGIRFLLVILTMVGLFVRPFMELAPGFADRVFGLGPDGLASILSSIGIGAMIASLWLARRGRTEGLTRIVTVSLAAQAGAVVLFTTTSNIYIAVVYLLLMGFFMLLTGVGAQTLIQNTVASAVRARVMSLFILLSWGLPALGALIGGWVASYAGLQITIGVAAAIVLIVYVWFHVAAKRLAPGLEADAAGKGRA